MANPASLNDILQRVNYRKQPNDSFFGTINIGIIEIEIGIERDMMVLEALHFDFDSDSDFDLNAKN